MKMKHFPVGQLGTNCYLIWDETTGDGAVIDPGADAPLILDTIRNEGIQIRYILLTHGHFDHTMAVPELKQATGAPVYIHKSDAAAPGSSFMKGYPAPPDTRFYDEGDTLPLGGMTIGVMHTPGHSRGSCVLRCGDSLFTGDTLFRGNCGRTDLPGGSYPDILRSLKRLSLLDGDFNVYPGHEGFSTLAWERENNYYMREGMNL